MSITADSYFPAGPAMAREPVGEQFPTRKKIHAPYLFSVWLAIALGALAMFEPSPSDIAIALLFVGGFFNGNLCWDRKLTVPLMLLALFMLANVVSLCYAIDLAQAAFYFAITTFMIVSWLFVLGILTKYGERGVNSLMLGFTVGGVVSAALALVCYFNLAPFGDWVLFYDRIKGFFKDPNVFGPYLVIVTVYALHRALIDGGLWRKLVWLASSLISSVGVLLCYSRAAWVNYVVTVLVFCGLSLIAKGGSGGRRRNLIYLAIFAVIVGGAIVYLMTIPQVSEVFSYRREMQDYDADRFATFSAALRLGLSNPLGVGPAQSFLRLEYATHNVYLRVFSENGVIGFLTFVGLVLITLTRSLLLSQKALSRIQRSLFALVAAALCGTLLNSFTIDTLHWRHFWLLLALGWTPLWRSTSPVRQRFREPFVCESNLQR